MKIDRVCATCGKQFQIEANRLKHGRGDYCSRACAYASPLRAQKLSAAGKARTPEAAALITEKRLETISDPEWKAAHSRKVERTCPMCGKVFQIYPSDAKNGKGVYCSKQCAFASPDRADRLSRGIAAAWKNPDTRRRVMEGIKKRSESSEWRAALHFQKGEAHPKYKGNKAGRDIAQGRYEYKAWRNAVFARDNYTCQECGANGVYLEVDHVKPWAEHPELRYVIDNGRTLCVACHGVKHGWKRVARHGRCQQCGKLKPANASRICHSCASKNWHKSVGHKLK